MQLYVPGPTTLQTPESASQRCVPSSHGCGVGAGVGLDVAGEGEGVGLGVGEGLGIAVGVGVGDGVGDGVGTGTHALCPLWPLVYFPEGHCLHAGNPSSSAYVSTSQAVQLI